MGKFVETSKTVTQNSRNSNILINPKLLRYLSSNGSQDKISKVSAKPQYNLSHSSIIANADGIASLSTLKNNNTMVISEASKRNGKFKVLSKTKLVRRRSTSSSSQTAVCGVHPRYNVTKTTPEAFKKNGKYKVVSKTKLVRRLSGSSSSQTSSLSIQPKIRDLKGNSEALKRNIGYRVISKTKLVRQSSDSSSRHAIEVAAKTKSSETSSLILPYYTPKVKSVPRPLKFPTRTRRFSTGTRANVKRRYSVMSPTKLIRSFSNTSSSNGDGISGKPRYFIKTDTKLVRRCSQSSTSNSKSLTNDEETKTNVIKSVFEKNKKFSILSKTKLVRRKSESGMNKTSKLLKNTIVSGPGIRGVQTIIKRHKLVRNARAKSGCWSPKILSASGGRNINTVYKIVNNCVKLSSRQKAARGIISKYKINRLKLESSEILRKNDLRNCSHLSKPEKKYKFSHTTRKGIINIGGILYKSTKTSLRKQLSKTTQESAANASENECIVWLRGDQFQLSAGGRTLKRVKDGSASSFSKHSLPRVHIGGLTYSRTKAGQYELTQTHQARAVVSSAKQRSMMTLSQRKKKGILQKRNEHCIFFNRFGRCTKKDKGQCPYIHDPQRVAICTRFLRGRCPVNNCPFSHTVDPDKMPVCSHFVRATCTRDGCPYRHVRVNPFAPICLDFLRGHCLAGEECKKQHVLVCEEFSRTGKCPRGLSCPLSHHRGRGKFRKSVTLEPADGENKKHFSFLYRKRKRSESTDVLGELKVKRRTEKKFKENAVKVVKQRYFHIPTHGEDDDEEKQKTVSECTQSYGVKTEEENRETKLLNKQKDNSTPVTSSQSFVACAITLQEKQMPHIHESREEYGKTQGSLFYNKSSNTLDLEEIRQRILQKVDKIKYLYSAHKNIVDVQTDPQNYERYNVKKETYLSFDKTDQPSTVGNREEIHKMQGNTKIQNKEKSLLECVDNATDTTESDMYRLQRAPLPQRLPSYIPLSMDEEAEDL
ncbi:Zinc finger CCCH domain-containing protein 3-like [Homarus americanus]|uniref:Zinc finger CCCH domain-containing protein 3 n=1 Tax=Homarus americanus TaxID=6706 RepID=A0A8J5JV54_HOMAM|nr:Zinc finger CCCH domain-containing protein 3-like [Homarus americanus]